MDFKIVWTLSASRDLAEIGAYILKDSPAAAERVGNDICRSVETLATFPLIGPCYPRGTTGSIREIISWNYRIFYRVSRERGLVEILRVWHGARDTPQINF